MTKNRRARWLALAIGLVALTGFGSPALAKKADDSHRSGAVSEGVININTATVEQLTWLPRIGQTKAERIVTFRERHSFRRVANLARVKGIGLKTVRRLRQWLVVKGPTTLTGPPKKVDSAPKKR